MRPAEIWCEVLHNLLKMANIRQIWRPFPKEINKKTKPHRTHFFNSVFVNEVCNQWLVTSLKNVSLSQLSTEFNSLFSWNKRTFIPTKNQRIFAYSKEEKKWQQQQRTFLYHTIPFSFRIPNGFHSFSCVGRPTVCCSSSSSSSCYCHITDISLCRPFASSACVIASNSTHSTFQFGIRLLSICVTMIPFVLFSTLILVSEM